VFQFHQPDTLAKWVEQPETLRSKLGKIPELNKERLRDAQFNAIKNLEISFKDNRPRALIQMATGAGKTFTACTFVYRLFKTCPCKTRFCLWWIPKILESRQNKNLSNTNPRMITENSPSFTMYKD